MERSALSCRQSLFGRAVCRMTTLLLAAGLLTVAGLPVLRPVAAAEGQQRLVGSDWLLGELRDSDLVVLDARSRERYAQGHIAGAVSLPVADTLGPDPHSDLAAPISTIQQLFGAAGVDQTTRVVIYDDGDMVSASRVFWILEVHGHRHVALLNPGYAHWQAHELPVSTQPARPAARQFVSQITPDRLATKFSTRLAISDPGVVILDVRPGAAYRGETGGFARKGHIPTAISLPFDRNLQGADAGLKPFSELEKLYQGIDKSKKVITYCDTGKESTLTYFILRQLGYDVATYDGSWYEWSNDPLLPVEVGGELTGQ
jgi:thiosulfate/3-mercaptopyruvate sulfurtransferase